MDLNPTQFATFQPSEQDYSGTSADYGAAHKGRESRMTAENRRMKAIGDMGRQELGTTDRARKYAGPVEAGVAVRKKFVPHAGTGAN